MTRRTSTVAAIVLCAFGVAAADPEESDARARNGLIAYTKETARCDDIRCQSYVWTMRPDGGGKRRLPCSTEPPGCTDALPVFSSGGTRLATAAVGIYDVSRRGVRLTSILSVRDTRGRVLRRIELNEDVTGLAWSADGARLAFNAFGSIYMVRTDGTEQTLFRKARALDVEWSRQGQLAWSSKQGLALRVTDRARTRVRTLRAKASSVAWSPDGRRLAYTAPDQLVKTIGVDGRRRRTVTRSCTGDDVQNDSGVAWSPDGRQLLCTNDDDQLLAVNVRTGRARVVVRNTRLLPITSFDWQRAPQG